MYLIAGILITFYLRPSLGVVLGALFCSILLYLFTFFRSRKVLFDNSLPGISSYLLIFSLGLSISFFSIPENQTDHYLQKSFDPSNEILSEGVITEELKPGQTSSRFIIKLRRLITEDSVFRISGRILLNLSSDSVSQVNLNPGASIIFSWKPKPIKPALNPFQFDYSEYMARQKVYSQLSLQQSEIRLVDESGHSLKAAAWNFREQLIEKLAENQFSNKELAVLQALVLGQKRDLDDNLYDKYAAAGAIHILAISGLHIGILLLLLNYLLKPMHRLKNGKRLKTILIIFLLWAFAFLTGLSPSVVRAVTMFSFLSIGMQMNRKTSTLNSLFLSLFFLLLIEPYFIFQVGFQLSYLAVMSIILFQPIIYRIYIPKNKLLDYFWKIISVSIAAQIGVLPLSLFYFHQFPGLFLLSNIIILPGLGLLLSVGILVFTLAYLDLLPEILSELLEGLIRLLNGIVEQIAGIESMVFSNIPFSFINTILSYIVIIMVFLLVQKISFKKTAVLLVSILLFQASVIYNKWILPSEELVVFNKNGQSLIVHKLNSEAKIMADSLSEKVIPEDYLRERQIQKIRSGPIPRIIPLKEKSVLVVDTSLNYLIDDYRPEILFLRKNAKVNLERLIKDLKPEEILADGSNTNYYLKKWKETARKEKIPFHHTGEKGAYILSSNEISLKKYPEIPAGTSAILPLSSLVCSHR